MASETPAATPNTETKDTRSAEPTATATEIAPKPEIEYDDFGLPIRKRRPKTPVEDSSDSEGEQFEDAVASRNISKEVVALPEGTEEKAEKPSQKSDKEGHSQGPAVTSVTVKKDGDVQPQPSMHVDKPGGKEEGLKLKPVENGPDQTADATTVSTSGAAPVATSSAEPLSPQPALKHRQQASVASISEFSHQNAVFKPFEKDKQEEEDDGGWQTMPSYARYDMYDDENRLIAKENLEELEDMHGYANVGGAAKGYTKVIMDDDADSQTSMDDNTAYLFKEKSTALMDEDIEGRDPVSQMQTTKNLLTEGQRVAYVGLVRLAMVQMENKFSKIVDRKSKAVKKALDMHAETTKMWSQKIMVRIYSHMEITASEQIMIEQLSEHGVVPADLTPALMKNARVRNPAAEEMETQSNEHSARQSVSSPRPDSMDGPPNYSSSADLPTGIQSPPPPPYEEYLEQGFEYPEVKSPSELPMSKNLDIDLRWTVLCDLFLLLVADSIYDSRSRELFEEVGKYLSVDWLETCRFEKRVTDALEMQEQADKENWNEDQHMASRAKRARNKRLAFMGLATVGGGLVIGLSAGLLAPVIGAGLAAGFTTIGVAGTSSFLAGAGGAAIVTSTGAVTGATIGVRAMNRRTGAVKTFEYRPLHNNKRTHLIITLAGWMNGKVDDVRLPYSTVDPIMGDIYSVLWEPEMLRSMGDTINILATEVNAS